MVSRRRRAPPARCGPARPGARSGTPRSGSPSTSARRTGGSGPRSRAHRLLEPVADRPPRAHVLRLLLGPHDLAEPRIPSQKRLHRLDGERVELLEPRDRNPARRPRAARGRRCRSRASPSRGPAARPSSWLDPRIVEHGMERPAGELLELDEACFRRSRPFGVITTSGRATASSACRRSRWKNCAAVVQLHTRMLSWAPSWRNRSSRALECSGPFPS